MNLKLTREQRIPHRLLSRYGDVDGRLDANLEALDKAESRRFNVTATLGESVSSSGDADSMGNALAAVERIVALIERDAAELEDGYQTAHALISAVTDADMAVGLTLSYKYEGGLSAHEISRKLGCSKKTVYEHLKRGLDMAFALLTEEES